MNNREIKAYPHNSGTINLDWNGSTLFTFRAWFDKPDEVCNVRAVANVPSCCDYSSFPLTYDEEEGCYIGTGVLGDALSFYDRKTKLWTKPNITSDVISQKSITISPNFDGFLMAYNEYKWSVLSVFSIVFLFWGILAVIALLRNAISSAISFVILLCVTIVFCIVILRLMKKKAEAMRENFAAQWTDIL